MQSNNLAQRSTLLPRGVLAGALLLGGIAPASSQAPHSSFERQRWHDEAQAVTIVRDDWGIAHIHGKTDADAVFGSTYAQAEDDFNRVERNYLTSLGRLAEADGEKALFQDLRQRLFIDPALLQQEYVQSPDWLKSLMDAWADGLNFFLAKHPEVHPKVLTRFEPWMALSFTEGSIGGDIERIDLKKLEAFYTAPHTQLSAAPTALPSRPPTPSTTTPCSSSIPTPLSSSGRSCR
jgi:acyl-homoserine-lactone acylase